MHGEGQNRVKREGRQEGSAVTLLICRVRLRGGSVITVRKPFNCKSQVPQPSGPLRTQLHRSQTVVPSHLTDHMISCDERV